MVLAAAKSIPVVSLRSHAKLCQFAGDYLRHRGCVNVEAIDKIWIDTATWWYEVSSELYSSQWLNLGVLISQFKLAQCQLVDNQLDEAVSSFFDLRHKFIGIGNELWSYKSDVMIAIISIVMKNTEVAGARESRTAIMNLNECGQTSRYQHAWGTLALAVEEDHQEISEEFASIGAAKLCAAIRDHGVGIWLGGDY